MKRYHRSVGGSTNGVSASVHTGSRKRAQCPRYNYLLPMMFSKACWNRSPVFVSLETRSRWIGERVVNERIERIVLLARVYDGIHVDYPRKTGEMINNVITGR